MKLRKLISLLLVSVYLFAVGGAAYNALACECVSFRTHSAHVCCHHCAHDCDTTSGPAVAGSCCGDAHSTEVELYTRVSSSDDEDQSRILVLDLPAALAAECPCPAHVPLLRETPAERHAPFIEDAHVLSVGLRAPPVLA